MNMMNLNGINRLDTIAPPQFPTTDLNYETELKGILEPILSGVLDMAGSAGWDRRKAAYMIMVLAAAQLPPRKPQSVP